MNGKSQRDGSLRCEPSYFFVITFLLSWCIGTGKFVPCSCERDLVSYSVFCSVLILSMWSSGMDRGEIIQ